MMKIFISIALFFLVTATVPASAGDVPVPDPDVVRIFLMQPDFDYTIFVDSEFCTALIYLIENDESEIRENLVRRAICALPETGDERAVEYLIEYIDDYPLDCLYGLGEFSTPESCIALMNNLTSEDEFNRCYAARSLAVIDFTVSDEMWALREEVATLLVDRIETEPEEWLMVFNERALENLICQVRDELDGLSE